MNPQDVSDLCIIWTIEAFYFIGKNTDMSSKYKNLSLIYPQKVSQNEEGKKMDLKGFARILVRNFGENT